MEGIYRVVNMFVTSQKLCQKRRLQLQEWQKRHLKIEQKRSKNTLVLTSMFLERFFLFFRNYGFNIIDLIKGLRVPVTLEYEASEGGKT